MPRLFEFGGNGFARRARGNGERNERGRNVDMLERAAHGVLSADRRDAQIGLRLERAQKRRERLPPTGGVAPRL